MRFHHPFTLLSAATALAACDTVAERNPIPTTQDRPLRATALFEDLSALARDLASVESAPPRGNVPAALTALSYDEYRAIRFRPDAAIWAGDARFEVQLFHPGSLYSEPVQIHLIEGDMVRPLLFDDAYFQYGDNARNAMEPAERLARSSEAARGYAGFRIHYPLNREASKDEVAVFLGASYFRLLGPGHAHGLSSRGLAVDVAEESGEEFPAFRAFWLRKPGANDRSLIFFGLLEGPSVVGAYQFELDLSDSTVLTVDARLFARKDIRKLGVAPLTSMYLYGPNDAARFDDYRPQVHDSDGLLMRTSQNEWIWRPLSNRRGVHVTSLRDSDPLGFGLVQRDRDFESYLDLEAQYHRRPSEWVEMGEGDWGSGGVELVEIPTPSEYNDNIVAYWLPDEPFRAGDERAYQYRLSTFDGRLEEQALAQVVRTRVGSVLLPGETARVSAGPRRFIVDFRDDGAIDQASPTLPAAVLSTTSGDVSQPIVQRLPEELGYRASFTIEQVDERPPDLRLFLEIAGQPVSETWSYLWVPELGR